MEKLIELLLEYKPQVHYLDKPKGVYDKKYGIGWYKREGDIGGWFSEEVIISKKFGFIKWLVDNDKIDLEKCGFKNEGLSGNWYDSGIAFVQNYDNDTYKVSEFYSPYLQLLMLLSISDTPIDDLISYLK